jgi:acetylornithine/succinyldiaminopimelate/putrescine aminotransferase
VQSEGGIRVPSPDYLQAAQQLCRGCGTLLVLDEVQSGMFRTGRFPWPDSISMYSPIWWF